MFARLAAFAAFIALVIPVVAADQPRKPVTLPKLDPDKLADPKEAAKAVEMLEKEFPDPKPEAVRMLIAILKGSQLMGNDGWFGPAETRYDWKWLANRHALEGRTTSITKESFRGPVKLFDALDRDGDGKITSGDLDWSDRNAYVMRANMLTQLFRRMDRSGDGKL